MKKKIVVLGSLGMAGHVMAEYLDSTGEYQIISGARKSGNYVDKIIDVTNFGELEGFLTATNADYVINCIGVLVSNSNKDPSLAILLNSYLPNFLSILGAKLNFKLIHLSTDCVFPGKLGRYEEDSFRDGDDIYARSKALGEVINKRDLTIRTPIIEPELKENDTGLLEWFLKQKNIVDGYAEAYWSSVTTLELAKATEEFIKQGLTGLYQLCPKVGISKLNLLLLMKKIWGREIGINPNSYFKIDKSLVSTRTDFTYPSLDYEKMLIEMKLWVESH